MDESLLIHICCAPCATVVIPGFRNEGFKVTGFFFNPNIHPYRENRRRLDALRDYAVSGELDLVEETEYPLESNLQMLLSAENRCLECFRNRLAVTACKARELGMGAFSTTLSVSPYQNHELILKAGAEAAEQSEIRFVYTDFRPQYRESIKKSRELGLYRQSYCGCVLSERDRYLKISSPGQSVYLDS